MRALRIAVLVATLALSVTPASAVHFYRGPGGGCTPATGNLGETVADADVDADIYLMHNSYNDTENGLPVVRIKAGDTVRWQWNSSHCHSVTSQDALFDSGFHYPTAPPNSPQVVPGFFDYPVPDFEPTLYYTKTFTTPGIYQYACVHHAIIGMNGAVIVDP